MLIGGGAFNERWQWSDWWSVCEVGDRLRFTLVTLTLSFLASLFKLEALCSLNEVRI